MIGWLRPRLVITVLMTCGVAARPASWRATVSTGRAKNKKNAPVATSQITTMPVRMRRTRNPNMAMSVASRRRQEGHHVGRVECAASTGGLVAPGPPPTAPPRGENPLGARIHRVAYPVAEQVEREGGDEQRRCREDHVPPGLLVEVLRVGQDVPPARYRRLDAEAQVGERRLEHHGRRDVQGGDHQHRRQQVGQDVEKHDPEGSGAQRSGRLDVFLFLYRQGLATDDPGDGGPGEERDHRDDHGQARTHHHRKREREHDVGERENRIDEPGQDRVHHPAEVPGDHAHCDARDRAEHGGDEADEQRDARAVENPDEQVAASAIGAEPEAIGAGPHGVSSRVLTGVRVRDIRRVMNDGDEQGRGEGEHHHDQDDDQRRHRHLVLSQPPPSEAPLAAPLDVDGLERRSGHYGAYAHESSLLPAAARSSPAITGKWQAVTWVVASPTLTSSWGSVSLHRACAFGQRGWNRHPGGGSIGDGTSPASMIRCRSAAASGSAAGAADSSAVVYGCRDELYTSSFGPSSQMRPRYMTATESLTCRTTSRSCAMNR